MALEQEGDEAPSVSVEYSTDTTTWTAWDGTSVEAVKKNSEYEIYVRGTNNRTFGEDWWNYNCFVIDGENAEVKCNGNIETLLDYTTVLAGQHPEKESCCFYGLFYECEALTSAPSLPATELSESCYANMFYG